MKENFYKIAAFFCRIVLPAAIALYGTLASIWNWPYRDAIIASAAAVDTFLNAILMIDSHSYFKDNEIVPRISSDLPEE